MTQSWVIVVPVKRLDIAKSRLAAQLGPYRRELALAMALDTVEVALSCDGVRVVVVTDDERVTREMSSLAAIVVSQGPRGGLNAALRHGAERARPLQHEGVAALTADLPAVTATELSLVLRRASSERRSFVPDAESTGTTLYASTEPDAFAPSFGAGSAVRHAVRATSLSAGSDHADDPLIGLRRDVDTVDDLRIALGLGVGPRTGAVVADLIGFDRATIRSAS